MKYHNKSTTGADTSVDAQHKATIIIISYCYDDYFAACRLIWKLKEWEMIDHDNC